MIPNALTEGGLLYKGGNFEQWETSLRPIMRAEGLEHLLAPEPLKPSSDEQDALACDIVRLYISAGLRGRIRWSSPPLSQVQQHRLHPFTVFNLLRRLAKPFRLLDLPPELRVRIYEFAIPDDHSIEIAPMRNLVTGYLPIIAVSRQVRAEALPVLYSQSVLKLQFLFNGSATGKEMPSFEEKERVFDLAKGIKAC